MPPFCENGSSRRLRRSQESRRERRVDFAVRSHSEGIISAALMYRETSLFGWTTG
jgi:hypothetical protein